MAFLSVGLVLLGVAVALVLTALEDGVTFFYTPSKVAANEVPAGQQFRLGGLVETGSRKTLEDGVSVAFRVTDCIRSLPVVYQAACCRTCSGRARASWRSDGWKKPAYSGPTRSLPSTTKTTCRKTWPIS